MISSSRPHSTSNGSSQPDLERVLDFVNEIRIAYTTAGTRQPMTFDRRERRASTRIPLQVPIQITPVEMQNGFVCLPEETADSIAGMTRDLSLKGVGFSHEAPVPAQFAVLTFGVPTNCPLSLVIEMNWTRKLKTGQHRSGARFKSLIETPESLRSFSG